MNISTDITRIKTSQKGYVVQLGLNLQIEESHCAFTYTVRVDALQLKQASGGTCSSPIASCFFLIFEFVFLFSQCTIEVSCTVLREAPVQNEFQHVLSIQQIAVTQVKSMWILLNYDVSPSGWPSKHLGTARDPSEMTVLKQVYSLCSMLPSIQSTLVTFPLNFIDIFDIYCSYIPI